MKKFISLFMLVVIAAIVCPDLSAATKKKGGKKKSAPALSVTKGEINTYADGLTTQFFSLKKGESVISVEYPLSGPHAVVTAIRELEKNAINENFTGSLETPDALLISAIRALGRGENVEEEIKIIFSSPKVVTVYVSAYDYERGAAHGILVGYGKTFFLADGSTFNDSMLPSFSSIAPYVREGLARNFDCSVDELENYLFGSPYDLEYPSDNAYFTDEGLVIQYSSYEIAPWSSGLPEAVIPYDVINRFISTRVK